MGTDQVPRSDVLMSVCCYPPFFCNMHKKVKKSAPAAVEGEHHSPDVEEGELQGSLAEVELQDILVVLLGPLHNPAVGVGLLHIQAVADVGVGLLHNQAVAVGVGLLHNQDLNHLQGIPVELLHIPDLQGHLDAPDEEPLDIPEEGLHFQGSPAVEVLHLQGMAERERLVGGPLPQDRLHQGNQTSVFCEVTCASVHAFLERRLFTYGFRFFPTKCLALLLLPIGAGLSVILLWWFLSRQFYSGETQTTNYTWATSLVRRHRAVSMTHIPCFADLACVIHHDMPSVLFSAGTVSMLKITPQKS